MSATDIAYSFQAEHGWTDAEMLEAALAYIDNQDSDDAFSDHLAENID